jgi:hypothetical protein
VEENKLRGFIAGLLMCVVIFTCIWIVLVDIGNGRISAGPLKTERVLAIEQVAENVMR